MVMHNVMLHCNLDPAHAVRLGLAERFGVVPSIMRNPVARNQCPRTVGAAAAMDEYRAGSRIIEDGQNLFHIR